MINSDSIAHLKKARWTSEFNRPLYDSYAFSLIPDTVTRLLTGSSAKALPAAAVGGAFETYDCVVLFLVDGFGWEFFERFSEKSPFLERFSREGVASKISSQFPSTTAAHVTTIHTGLEVGLTGIYEWFYYEPLVGELIAPLPFSYAGDHVSEKLAKRGFRADALFPFETVYQKLSKLGVKSFVIQHEEIAHSSYSQALSKGAEMRPYTDFTKALGDLREICERPKTEPTYIFVYFSDIDAMGHRHGIDSPQFQAAVEQYWNAIETHLWQKITPSGKTAFLFTADHGMAPVDPQTTVYLNQIFPEVIEFIQETPSGKKCVPAGSSRDFFLHCKEERVTELQGILQEKLQGKAEVFLVESLLEQGFFGKEEASLRMKERVGNLVILPFWGRVCGGLRNTDLSSTSLGLMGGLPPLRWNRSFSFAKNNSRSTKRAAA